ncbi:MAG: hypothetical protein K2Q22_11465 [Cytophagales bacterium]|nr:hypothetical protein [Cytophagales bacterium]
MAKISSFLFCTTIFTVTFGQLNFTLFIIGPLKYIIASFISIFFVYNEGMAQSKKEETDLCKLRNKMLESEILKLDDIVKKQHEENIALKAKIQNHDPKVVRTYEEEFKKAKASLSKFLEAARKLEEKKSYEEAADIYTAISSYFPGTYEAYEANRRLPEVLPKIKRR